MNRSRRSVKLPITITHSRSHHRAVNKIISTTLGMNNRDRAPWSRWSQREYVARRRLTTAMRKRPRHGLIAKPPLWFPMWKNALRTNRWLVNRHFSIDISQRYPDGNSKRQDISTPRLPFPDGYAADSKMRFPFMIKIRRGQLSIDENYNRDIK